MNPNDSPRASPEQASDPLQLRATPHRLRIVARAAGWSSTAEARAIDITVSTPPASEWARFLSGTLALFGAMLLVAGATTFVAYNWERLGRFGKFALFELGIVVVMIIAWKKLPQLSGQIALFSASLLVGPLLAVYGQTYQTGADPYGLFLGWSLLILPWAIISRFGANWVLVLLLLDVAVGLFVVQILAPRTTEQGLVFPLFVAALHAMAVVAWELQLRRVPPYIAEPWALRVIGFVGFLALAVPAVLFIVLDTRSGLTGAVGAFAAVAAVAGGLRYYSRARRDRFMSTVAGVTGMGMLTAAAARVVFDLLDLEEMGLFAMAAVLIWQITFGVKWFRRSRAA